jgi:hypothetical protein
METDNALRLLERSGFNKETTRVPFELKKLNIDVAALSETNKKRQGDEYLKDFTHFWIGVNKGKRAHAGVSIVINNKYKNI